MELHLRLYDVPFVKDEPLTPSDVALLHDSKRITAALAKVPIKERRQRKFVVLMNDKKSYVLIGPEFVDQTKDPSFYMHKSLRQVGLLILDKKGTELYTIKGGGTLEFEHATYMNGWYARFGGSSADYGTYDPTVLLYAERIADWLGMAVQFAWRDTVVPTAGKKTGFQ